MCIYQASCACYRSGSSPGESWVSLAPASAVAGVRVGTGANSLAIDIVPDASSAGLAGATEVLHLAAGHCGVSAVLDEGPDSAISNIVVSSIVDAPSGVAGTCLVVPALVGAIIGGVDVRDGLGSGEHISLVGIVRVVGIAVVVPWDAANINVVTRAICVVVVDHDVHGVGAGLPVLTLHVGKDCVVGSIVLLGHQQGIWRPAEVARSVSVGDRLSNVPAGASSVGAVARSAWPGDLWVEHRVEHRARAVHELLDQGWVRELLLCLNSHSEERS